LKPMGILTYFVNELINIKSPKEIVL